MRARRRLRSTEAESGIDITPMLDVVFIMLIFFIVTTSFVKESGIKVSRPSAQTSKKQPQATIIVGIKANGEVWVQKRKVDLSALRANIERLHAESPEGTVVVTADKRSETGLLVDVMDQIKLAGVEKISISADSKN